MRLRDKIRITWRNEYPMTFTDSGRPSNIHRASSRWAMWRWLRTPKENDASERFIVIDEDWLAKYPKTEEGARQYRHDRSEEWRKQNA